MVFEFDSMLIVMQMSGRWGCHRRDLRDLLAECYDLGEQLTQAGCAWSIRHIHRESKSLTNSRATVLSTLQMPVHPHRDNFGDPARTKATGRDPSCENTPPYN